MVTAAQAKQAVEEWEPTDSQGLPLLITSKLWPEEKKRVVDRALDLAREDPAHRRSAERGWSKVKYTVWFHEYWLRALDEEKSLAAGVAAAFAESDEKAEDEAEEEAEEEEEEEEEAEEVREEEEEAEDEEGDHEDEAAEPVSTPERRPRTDGDTKPLPRVESNTDTSDDDVNGRAEELNEKCTVEPPSTAHPAACGGFARTVTAAVVVFAVAVSLLRLHTGTEA